MQKRDPDHDDSHDDERQDLVLGFGPGEIDQEHLADTERHETENTYYSHARFRLASTTY